jgi:hypothetical protein
MSEQTALAYDPQEFERLLVSRKNVGDARNIGDRACALPFRLS